MPAEVHIQAVTKAVRHCRNAESRSHRRESISGGDGQNRLCTLLIMRNRADSLPAPVQVVVSG